MLKAQVFKTLAGAQKRAAFERSHSPYAWAIVRCHEDGSPDTDAFQRGKPYGYRLLRGPKRPAESNA